MDHTPEGEQELKTPDETPPEERDDQRPTDPDREKGHDEQRPDLPAELPVLPVRNVIVFPGTVVPLSVGREKSKRLIDAVLAGDKLLAVFTQRHEDVEDPGIDDVYRVGTAATVLKLLRMPDGTNSLLVHGLVRVGLEEFVATEPYWRAAINPHEDTSATSLELEALVHSARETAAQVIDLSPNVPDEAQQILHSIQRAGPLADFMAANLSLGVVQKQELLETFDIADRLRKINATLNNQLEILQLSQKIQSEVKQEIDKSQREYYLHEQLKAIQKELGETDARAAEMEELRRQVEAAGMPELVLKEAKQELERLERIPQASPEYGVIRDYLDWLRALPWQTETADNLDLDRAAEILDADHYGLEKIKRRILEYLAVRKLKPDGKGPILCFAGPPGVGKTSLGQSIARALGRKFIRMSLGGVHDEADIRGHRRTYIGAIPGRLMQEIRKCGSRNPVLMLDEMDKIGADFRGDPASALLEVLDPAQNHSFTDHYLAVPFDLSKVLFIGTANYMDPVALALKDRMEVIDLPGYTTAEKLEIARRYLVTRQLDENGLADQDIAFEDEALRAIIERYTREAGVRNLERTIGTICRGLAARVARQQPPDRKIEVDELEEFLGPRQFEREQALRTSIPGVATGLAYTPVGGEIIFVETIRMPGGGTFSMTGQIGDVMRESAQAALSLVRSRAAVWNVPSDAFSESDVHIHVPAGGVPKDGPSAGVAIVTALVSLFTDQVVDPQVAMTGEITLRGLVLPIGGVKEKVLGAHRAGLKTVVLPARNKRDLHDVPEGVRNELNFVFAETVEDALHAALPEFAPRETGRKTTGRARSPRRKTATKSQTNVKKKAASRPARRKVSAVGTKRGSRKTAAARRGAAVEGRVRG
ncbi:MAG: endopeptidase La [Planctomycetes bacterium]|nr:endopeptidase La [Planctomycetota bacterium]